MTAPILDQVNIVSANLDASIAFYRRLGVDIPDQRVWRTATGAHHASATTLPATAAIDLDLDSCAFAAIWNSAWRGRTDLRGRIVVGFKLASRDAVDETFADLTRHGYHGLQPPYDSFWGSRYAVVEDPDGVAVGLMSPPVEQHRTTPPTV